MKRLNDIPLKDLRVGDKVVSVTGKNGVIMGLDPNNDNFVTIKWEDGNESGWYHPLFDDRVLYGEV